MIVSNFFRVGSFKGVIRWIWVLGLVGMWSGCRGQEIPKNPNLNSNQNKMETANISGTFAIQDSSIHFELIPVEQREVYDHYINSYVDGNKEVLEIFDGKNVQTISFAEGEMIGVAKDQKSFCVYKIKKQADSSTIYHYTVELRDIENKVVSTTILHPLGSFESEDEIYPLNNIEGIVHKAYLPYPDAITFAIYNRIGNRLEKKFEYYKPKNESFNGFTISEDNKTIITSYSRNDEVSSKSISTFIESLDINGTTNWKYDLNSTESVSEILISPYDGTIVFSVWEQNSPTFKLCILTKFGRLMKIFDNVSVDLFNTKFQFGGKIQYLSTVQHNNSFYLINLVDLTIENYKFPTDGDYQIASILLNSNIIIGTYYKGIYPTSTNMLVDFFVNDGGYFFIKPQNRDWIFTKTNFNKIQYIDKIRENLFLVEKHHAFNFYTNFNKFIER
jgi:hypothetical protein